PQLLLARSPDLLEVLERLLDLPGMMPPKVEVGWPDRPATEPLHVYRAGRGLGFFSSAKRVLLAPVRGRAWSSRQRRRSLASPQTTRSPPSPRRRCSPPPRGHRRTVSRRIPRRRASPSGRYASGARPILLPCR